MDHRPLHPFLLSSPCCAVLVLCCAALTGRDETRRGGVLPRGGEDDDNDSTVVSFPNVSSSLYWRSIAPVSPAPWHSGTRRPCISAEEVKLKKCGSWLCIPFHSLRFFIGIVVWRSWSGDGNREIRVLNLLGGLVP